MIKKTVQPKQKNKKRFSIGAIIYGVLAAIVIVGGIAGFMLTQSKAGTDARSQAYSNVCGERCNTLPGGANTRFCGGNNTCQDIGEGPNNGICWSSSCGTLDRYERLGNYSTRFLADNGNGTFKYRIFFVQKNGVLTAYDSNSVPMADILKGNVSYSGNSDNTIHLTKEKLFAGSDIPSGKLLHFTMVYEDYDQQSKRPYVVAQYALLDTSIIYKRTAKQQPNQETPTGWTKWASSGDEGIPGQGQITSFSVLPEYVATGGATKLRQTAVRNGVIYTRVQEKQTDKSYKWTLWGPYHRKVGGSGKIYTVTEYYYPLKSSQNLGIVLSINIARSIGDYNSAYDLSENFLGETALNTNFR